MSSLVDKLNDVAAKVQEAAAPYTKVRWSLARQALVQ
jgi:hypothetical protein